MGKALQLAFGTVLALSSAGGVFMIVLSCALEGGDWLNLLTLVSYLFGTKYLYDAKRRTADDYEGVSDDNDVDHDLIIEFAYFVLAIFWAQGMFIPILFFVDQRIIAQQMGICLGGGGLVVLTSIMFIHMFT